MLILIRRIFALLLFPVFLVLFIATLLIWRVQDTFGNPEYIKGELVKADIYNFVYDDVAVPFVAEALDTPEDFLNDDLIELEIRPDEDAVQLVGFVRDFMPPEEAQARVEHMIDEFIPYITGDTDTFAIQLRIGERVSEWPDLLPARLDALDAGNRLSTAAIAPALEEGLDALSDQGLDVSVTRARAEELTRTVAPGDWIEAQVVTASREIADWLTRDKEEFVITIQFADRIPLATQAVKDVLDEANAEEFLFTKVIEPELTNSLGSFTELSHEIAISDEEVTDAIRAVAPPEWIREQRNSLLDSLSAYFTGESEELVLTVELAERAETASGVLIDLAKKKLEEVINSIPTCTSLAQGVTATRELQAGQIPSCKPPGFNAGPLIATLAAPFEDDIQRQIVALVPADFVFSDSDLEEILGEGTSDDIEKIREWIADGFVYSSADIQEELVKRDSDFTLDDLDVVRDVLDDDFTLTEVDFTDRIVADDPDAEEFFDDIRGYVGQGRDLWFVTLVLPGLILLLIGFLGGRNWNSRLKWALVPIFVAGIAVWVATSPVYDRYAQEEIDRLIVDATDDIQREETRLVVTDAINKLVDVGVRWKNGYGGLARSFAIGSGIVLAISFAYSMFGGRLFSGPGPGARRRTSTVDEQSQAAYEALKADEETTRLDNVPNAPPGQSSA